MLKTRHNTQLMNLKLFYCFFLIFLATKNGFASPFDVVNKEEKEVKEIESTAKKTIFDFVDKEKNTSDAVDLKETELYEEKIDLYEARLQILHIKSGKQATLKIQTDREEKFDCFNLKLEKCYKFNDGKYQGSHIAQVIVKEKDFASQLGLTFSNDLSLSDTLGSKYLVKAECY